MRIINKKAAVSTAVVGLLAFGAVASSGGSAFASPMPNGLITGCTSDSAIAVGLQPNCTAIGGSVGSPTAVIIDLDTDQLAQLISDQLGQGLSASWTLSCVVNGAAVNVPGTYDVTSASQTPFTVIDLQTAVGSPEPNQCSVNDLTVETTLPLNASDGEELTSPFTAGVAALAATAVPGSIYQQEGSTSTGAKSALCADDTANGNAGSKIQGYQCLGDLADSFVQTSAGQLMHNGDCVTASGSSVVLAACTLGATNQEWSQSTAGGQLTVNSSGLCLTAPSAKNGTQLTVASCGSGANQKWTIPVQAAPVSGASALRYHFAK